MKHVINNSQENKFLYFSNQMPGDFFSDSLIYLCEHNNEGAFGFIVNQPFEVSVSSLFSKLNPRNNQKVLSTDRIMRGGPVEPDRIFILHEEIKKSFKQTSQITNNLYITTSEDFIKYLSLNNPIIKSRILIGYCGWGPGQLEDEIKTNSWQIIETNEDIIFDSLPHQMVPTLSQRLGYDIRKIVNSNTKNH